MPRSAWPFIFVVAAAACGPSDTHRSDSQPQAPLTTARTSICASGPRGLVVSLDSVANFSTAATLGKLRQQCNAGDTTLYDAVGWQAVAWQFPFAGARVLAVESKHGLGESIHDDEVPDLWVVQGDSVRLPDGQLMPPTLGILRSRYGFAVVDDNTGGDDMDDPQARSCRFPYLRFSLAVNDTARHVPDSARLARVEMSGPDSTMTRFCIAHQRPDKR